MAGLTATYAAAFAAGLLLVGFGVFKWWQVRTEPPPEPIATTAAPALPADTVAAAEEPALDAPVASKPIAVTREPDCTDLRALFGLGEQLTEAQKNYLQQHC